MYCLFFLPAEKRVRIERWLRGREDHRKLQQAECVIVSFGKSGRTWLRVMMSRFYQIRYGLSERHLIAFTNLHNKNKEIPLIFFSHDNYLKDYTKNETDKSDYYGKKVVLLVRDPADTAVSQFHQWKFRMSNRKKLINDYPLDENDMGLYEFVMSQQSGLPKIIDYMNGWARELHQFKEILIVRYEDMRAEPAVVLGKVMEFIGTPATSDELEECVRFASVDNMRALETKRVFWLSGTRMTAKDKNNPNSFKVRRAKVGGYKDDFSAEQQARIDAEIQDTLLPDFGYTKRPAGDQPAVA
jgi:hypothetical protein